MNRRIADNVIPISTPLDISFFRAWLDFTAPLHNLTNSERQVMACYLKKHYELSKDVLKDSLLGSFLMSYEVKKEVMETCNIKPSSLQVILSKFRKTGLMVDGKINPKLIPAITKEVEDSKEFRLMVRFTITNDNAGSN